MITHPHRERPSNWSVVRKHARRSWFLPFLAFEWSWQWVAYLLSRWSFLDALDYLGSLSVLIAVVFYFHDSANRVKQRHYQAWQVINTAQGKGGSGGRIEALEELNADGVPLVGVDVSSAFLQGLKMEHANLLRANFGAADVRNSDLSGAGFIDANLRSANLRGSNLENAVFTGAELAESDMLGSDLSGCNFDSADLSDADLRSTDLRNIVWQRIGSIRGANIADIKNAPTGFVEWALKNGAVQLKDSEN